MSFDKFNSRVTIRGRLIAETGLHIGAGGSSIDPSATDSPVIRDRQGRPFIPGSSLKGALRASVERIVRSLERGDFKSCDPLADPCIPPQEQNGQEGMKEIKDELERRKDLQDKNGDTDQAKFDNALTDAINTRSCSVCRAFGSPWLSSHISIRDAFIVESSWGRRVELRDGVGIDRDTETARAKVKYDFEVVAAKTSFAVEIVAENADEEAMGLLSLGLREMEDGRVSLGGKTTRGLGHVTLVPDQIEIVDSHKLLDYLISRKGEMIEGPTAHDYLTGRITWLVDRRIKAGGNNA